MEKIIKLLDAHPGMSLEDIATMLGMEPEQAAAMAAVSDGAIVGSAIIRIIAEHGKDSVPYVGEYIRSMKEALKR